MGLIFERGVDLFRTGMSENKNDKDRGRPSGVLMFASARWLYWHIKTNSEGRRSYESQVEVGARDGHSIQCADAPGSA